MSVSTYGVERREKEKEKGFREGAVFVVKFYHENKIV